MEEKTKYQINKKYAEKYLSQFEKITLRVKPEEKKQIESLASAAGKSVNQYMKDKALGIE